ncbi:unnamed protein product [Clonostachys byssicola]|uniref:Uncharacterized protein n=1 Tax=Clonostachys byssicola TaxID=160290 RepID=A0A9N9U1L3_9HYPO|nr:unnamed protein product [Clonostachys byssicola]
MLDRTGNGLALLNCRYQSNEDESIAIYVKDLDLTMERFRRIKSSTLVKVSRFALVQNVLYNEASIEDSRYEYGSHLDGATGLMTASRNGHVRPVWYLLTLSSIESWLRRREGRKAIFEAIQGGNEMIVRILLHRSGIRAHESEEEQESPTAFLLAAIRAEQHPIVKLLLERGFRPDPLPTHHTKSTSALSLAASYGLESSVKLLLQYRANVNWLNDKSQTPLCFAAEKGHENIIRILINHDAELNPFQSAGKSALCYASEAGYESIVRLLIAEGANVNSQDEEERTPLLHAILSNHVHIAQELIDSGASPHSLDNKGRSPLSHASERGHDKVAELLINNGAKIESEDDSHKTPLAYAATELEFETIRVLLKHGADIEAVDDESAMSLALVETHPDIMRAFSNHSAVQTKVENHTVHEPFQGDVVDDWEDIEETRDAVQVVPRNRKKLKPKPKRAQHRPKAEARWCRGKPSALDNS